MTTNHKLWGGRFQEAVAVWVDEFGASIQVDQRLAVYDIKGSIAHVTMLKDTGIIAADDADKIKAGLEELLQAAKAHKLKFRVECEDIHMNIETLLTEKIGPIAGKLHTARSRNDQVALDMHLYLKDQLTMMKNQLWELRSELVELACQNVDTIMPGYTHLQHAQPISFAQHLLAYYQMFTRDYERFAINQKHTDYSPLGACALAGTTFPIDRFETCELLGMKSPYANSMDAVSDRDFILEFLSNASIMMMHASRLCEELINWCSHEYQFVTLSDTFATGSSIMPQKKNPDMAELVRGKTGRVYGNLFGLLTIMKGLPLAYNKDLQEDKEKMFDTVDTVSACCAILTGMLKTLTVNKDVMEHATHHDLSNATELADYLANTGIPFRHAHAIVGKLVYECSQENKTLSDISLVDYQKICSDIKKDVYDKLQPKTAVKRRTSYGATGFEQVTLQLAAAKKTLVKDAH